MTASEETSMGGSRVRFPPTLWTRVARAKDLKAPEAREALGELIQRYWKPVYFFIRRRGHDVESAKDLTQSFFAHLMDHELIARADPVRGRFRTFLLKILEYFLSDAYDRERAKKRGGGAIVVPIDEVRDVGAADETPEREFNRQWAESLVAQAFESLQKEHREGKSVEALRIYLSEDLPSGQATRTIAARLGMTDKNVENALFRMKRAYRQALLDLILQYVVDRQEAQKELQEILAFLREG